MPYSRKPVIVTTANTLDEFRIELNAIVTKLNELFNGSNELQPAPNAVFDSPQINNPTISGGSGQGTSYTNVSVNSSTFNNGTHTNSNFDNTNTSSAQLTNNTGNGLNLTNSVFDSGSVNNSSINDGNITGFDPVQDETVSVSSHTTGSTTISLTLVSKDLSGGRFWYDGREYYVLSSDDTADTMTLQEVPADVTFSGNIVIRFGFRTKIRNPEIVEPIYSGVVHMDGDLMNMVIKHGTTAERTALLEGVANELWFDTDIDTLFIYDGNASGGIPVKAAQYHETGTSLPASGYAGQEFFDTDDDQWYKWNDTQQRWESDALSGGWITIVGNTTAVAGNNYLVDTTATQITLTLPASPIPGDQIEIVDGQSNFLTLNCIIDRNGQPIEGGTSNITLNTNDQYVKMVYVDGTVGWKVLLAQSNAFGTL